MSKISEVQSSSCPSPPALFGGAPAYARLCGKCQNTCQRISSTIWSCPLSAEKLEASQGTADPRSGGSPEQGGVFCREREVSTRGTQGTRSFSVAEVGRRVMGSVKTVQGASAYTDTAAAWVLGDSTERTGGQNPNLRRLLLLSPSPSQGLWTRPEVEDETSLTPTLSSRGESGCAITRVKSSIRPAHFLPRRVR